MKNTFLLFFIIAIHLTSFSQQKPIKLKADRMVGNYIPKDIYYCFKVLDNELSDSVKNDLKSVAEKDIVGKYHLGLGTWMRNRWRLWWDSKLTKYFNKKGVYGAENISCIILKSYHRHLKGIPIDLEAQINKMNIEQKALQEPTKEIFPRGSGNLEFKSGYYYDRTDGGLGLAQIGTSVEGRDVWLYDYFLGWSKITYDQLSELNNANTETREKILNKIFDKK